MAAVKFTAAILWRNKEIKDSEDYTVLQIVSFNGKDPVVEKRNYYWSYPFDSFKMGKAKGFTFDDLAELYNAGAFQLLEKLTVDGWQNAVQDVET